MVAHQSNRMQEGFGSFQGLQETFNEALERPAELVKEYPLSTMLLMFGVGLGVGVVLSQTVCSAFAEAMETEPTMAEKVKRQVYDAVSQVLPPSMMKQLHSFTS